jgi:hypothetical protein
MKGKRPRRRDRSGLLPKNPETGASKIIPMVGGAPRSAPAVDRPHQDYFDLFFPFLLDDLPPYVPEPGSKWQPMTEEHARRLVAKYPDNAEFWQRAIEYLDREVTAGAPPAWHWQTWCALEGAWWCQ